MGESVGRGRKYRLGDYNVGKGRVSEGEERGRVESGKGKGRERVQSGKLEKRESRGCERVEIYREGTGRV